jgi:hypothetical protein
VHLVTDTGTRLDGAATEDPTAAQEDLLLDGLAVVETSHNASLRPAATALRHAGDGLTVAVLGAMSPDEASELIRYRHGAGRAVAVVLDVTSWQSKLSGGPSAPTRSEDVATVLRAAGWRVVPLHAGETLASVWPLAGHTSYDTMAAR